MAFWRSARPFAMLALVGLLTGAVHAAPIQGEIMESITVTTNAQGFQLEAGDGGNFQLPKFDPSDPRINNPYPTRTPQLVVVIINVTGRSFNGLNAVDNESKRHTGWGNVSIGTDITVRALTNNVPAVVLVFPQDSNSGFLDYDDPAEDGGSQPTIVFGGLELNGDYLGPDALSTGQGTSSDANTLTLDTAQNDLSEFVGPGTLDWSFLSKLATGGSWDVNPAMATTDPPDFDFTAEVRYLYFVEPEPGTLGLLGISGVAMLLRRRRRRTA